MVVHPVSVFGLYPYSYPSFVPFLLSTFSNIMGLSIETIGEAELISTAAYDRMSTEVRAALHWEASQDLHKDRELINWSGIDFSVGPRMSEEAEADFLERQMLGVLLKAQIEKRRKQV